jgi:hypothetical protein
MIIKYFKLFEMQKRYDQKGTFFSNKHRYPNLPKYAYLIDIDNVVIKDGKIKGIIETKYKFESKNLGNPLKGSYQRTFLNVLCKKLKIKFYLFEEKSNSLYKILDDVEEKINDVDGDIVNTDDVLFFEIRRNNPIAIMFRTDGIKLKALKDDLQFRITKAMASRLEIDIILVNDTIDDNIIYLRKLNDDKIYEIESDNGESWVDVYKHLNIL